MIEKMAETGVDCVKFQMTDPYLLYSDDSFKASYQEEERQGKGAREMSLSYQLKRDAHIPLYEKCKECGVDYVCSAFWPWESVLSWQAFRYALLQIASGEIFSLDMIDYISERNKPVILSTGMATYEEVESIGIA